MDLWQRAGEHSRHHRAGQAERHAGFRWQDSRRADLADCRVRPFHERALAQGRAHDPQRSHSSETVRAGDQTGEAEKRRHGYAWRGDAAVIRSALIAAGPQAAHIAGLWWLMFWICLAVLLLVASALLIAVLRARVRGAAIVAEPQLDTDRRLEHRIGWTVVTCVVATIMVLFIFLVASAVTGHRLALLASDNPFTIRLTGYRWWWKGQYLDPTLGRPILINTQSQDVIHSFWVPALHGKKDLVPGHPSSIWIQADRPGRYEGQCAEFCGL